MTRRTSSNVIYLVSSGSSCVSCRVVSASRRLAEQRGNTAEATNNKRLSSFVKLLFSSDK